MKNKIYRILKKIIFGKKIKGEISKKYIYKYLPKNPVIIEAGAHIGTDTVEMATQWENATIYAFEPVPDIYQKLVDNTKKHKNIKCFELALGDKEGISEIFISGGGSDASSSLLKPKDHLKIHPNVSFSEKVQINTITLDSWAKNNNISRIDFLWLDLQGYELQVLKNGRDILKTVSAIMTEVSLIETYSGGALYPEIKNWLEQEGFIVVKEELPWEDMGNVLFVRKEVNRT